LHKPLRTGFLLEASLVAFGSCSTAFQGYVVASDEQCNLSSPVGKLTAC